MWERGFWTCVIWKRKNIQYILNTLCTLLPIVPNAQIETYWYINKEEKRAKSQPSIFRIRRKKKSENSRKGGQRNRKGARDKRVLKIKGFQAEFLKRIREYSLLPVKYYRRFWLWKYKRLSSATKNILQSTGVCEGWAAEAETPMTDFHLYVFVV